MKQSTDTENHTKQMYGIMSYYKTETLLSSPRSRNKIKSPAPKALSIPCTNFNLFASLPSK